MSDKSYDSTDDTLAHIDRVRTLLHQVIYRFEQRYREHDKSKLEPPEKEIFDEFTPKLKDTEYGSSEYKQFLEDMGPALAHHYEVNSHHPEHYPDGISGMSLLDLVEMLCDWKAATERHSDGSLYQSIVFNQTRFGYSDELRRILINTAKELGILDGGEISVDG